MNLNEFTAHLKSAAKAGTLMTPKHDPNNLSTTYSSHRTVLSHELAGNLEAFICSGQYVVYEYENRRIPKSPLYFEIIPSGSTTFTVPASGVAPNSLFATSTADRIVAVSGNYQGWHLFGECSTTIQQKVSAGDLVFRHLL